MPSIELNRAETFTVLRGLVASKDKYNTKIKRIQKRGFRDHERAELAMEGADIDEAITKLWKYKHENWPDTK